MDDILIYDFKETYNENDNFISDIVSVNDIDNIIDEGEFENENIQELYTSVSGSNVTYYVYNNTYVSMNDIEEPEDFILKESVSYNIINKPLNEYTVQESLTTIFIVFFLGVGLYLLIRRSILRWR